MDLTPGLAASARLVVTAADTAIAFESGDVPVLATPRLLALCEAATVRAVTGHILAGDTTVGVEVHLEHRSPSPVGATVEARATLEAISGRRLRFRVEVVAGDRLAATGTVVRVVVDRARFLAGSA